MDHFIFYFNHWSVYNNKKYNITATLYEQSIINIIYKRKSLTCSIFLVRKMQSLFLIQLILKSIFFCCFSIPLRFSHSLLRRQRASPVCKVKLPKKSTLMCVFVYVHVESMGGYVLRIKNLWSLTERATSTTDLQTRTISISIVKGKRSEMGRRRAPVVPLDAHLLQMMFPKFFFTFCIFWRLYKKIIIVLFFFNS